ncbi:Fc.00g037260.m01.CDS01 [Cosmosporella sp. VM-42]
MAPNNKDMRRADLIVPYQEPKAKGEGNELSSTLSTTLPMAAMFTRNKFVGWAAVVFSIQSWLGESEETKKNASTPGYFSVGMARTFTPSSIPATLSEA